MIVKESSGVTGDVIAGGGSGGLDQPLRSRARARERTGVVESLMVTQRWERGMAKQLAEEWGCSAGIMDRYVFAATYHLERLGARDLTIEKVRKSLERWVDEGNEPVPVTDKKGDVIGFRSSPDRVPAANTLLKSLGALTDKVELEAKVHTGDMAALQRRMVDAFREPDPVTAEALREAGWIRVGDVIETGGESE
jgi:hypothetical protein